MFIALDIGNSCIKTGIFNKDVLEEYQVFKSVPAAAGYLKGKNIKEAALSSVVPAKSKILKSTLKAALNISTFEITRKSEFNLKIEYRTPETLGIDRLCSAEGAFYLYKKSEKINSYSQGTYVLSIDAGTATTINVVEYPGRFTGGLIAPGIEMMFKVLSKNTAQLPLAKAENFDSVPGTDTRSSIAGGVIMSAAGMIEKTLDYLKNELKAEHLEIYITGGNINFIIPHLKFPFFYEPALVLYGIRSIYIKNTAKP